MKKIIPALLFCFTTYFAIAQGIPSALEAAKLIPTIQVGFKAGANLTSFTTNINTLNSQNNAGYLAGFWFQVGKGGVLFQPEVYITGKNVTLKDTLGTTNKVKFTSIDVPILVVKKIGLGVIGAHFETGPVISFVIDKNQSLSAAVGKITALQYKDQAYAWQFGTGIDLEMLKVDLRYEIGLSSLSQDGYPSTKISMFNLTLAYRLF